MKKTLLAVALAFAATTAFAAPISNTNPKYDLKAQYKVAGKQYNVSSEAAVPFDSATATSAPFDEVLIAPGKTVNVPGKTLKVITMVPGPDTSFLDALAWLG